MKKSYKPFAYLLLLLLIFFLLPGLIHAQGPGDQGTDPGCGPDDPCPIDGGLVALIALGVGYGIKKIKYHNKPEPIS